MEYTDDLIVSKTGENNLKIKHVRVIIYKDELVEKGAREIPVRIKRILKNARKKIRMKKHMETKKMKTTYENDVRKERITKRIPLKCVYDFNYHFDL